MAQYVSRERVYELGADGLPHRLKYPVGWPIDEAEAIRQGIIPDPEADEAEPAAKRRTPTANKRRTPTANKSHHTTQKEN